MEKFIFLLSFVCGKNVCGIQEMETMREREVRSHLVRCKRERMMALMEDKTWVFSPQEKTNLVPKTYCHCNTSYWMVMIFFYLLKIKNQIYILITRNIFIVIACNKDLLYSLCYVSGNLYKRDLLLCFICLKWTTTKEIYMNCILLKLT